MKARTTLLDPLTNERKIQKLNELHVEYRAYVQACIDQMVSSSKSDLAPSERRTFFLASENLSSQIVKNAQAHAVTIVHTWALGLYARKLKGKVGKESFSDHEKLQLRTIGKYGLTRGGKFGKGEVSQELVNLYWSWVWDPQVVGNTPKVGPRLPINMTEMTCVFSEAKEATHFDGFWFGFSSLESGARRVQIPLKSTPYLKSSKEVVKSVMARKNSRGQWTFQFTDKSPEETHVGDQGRVAVDVGLNVLAATSDGRIYGRGFKPKFDKLYAKVRDLRSNRQRQGLQENSPRLERLETKLSGMLKTETGKVSNKLVRDFPGYTFVLEDLDLSGCRGQKRFAYRALQTSLERKAIVLKVNPAYSSQVCPSCGYLSRKNRKGIKFQCRGCGRLGHADAVGGLNLLGRSEEKQIGLKTPVYHVKQLLQRRFLATRRSPGVPARNAPVPSGRKLTTEVPGSPGVGTASNLVVEHSQV